MGVPIRANRLHARVDDGILVRGGWSAFGVPWWQEGRPVWFRRCAMYEDLFG